jgi:hypothetical protein
MKASPYLNQLTNELVLYAKGQHPDVLALLLPDGDMVLDMSSPGDRELFCTRGIIAAVTRQIEIIDASSTGG